MTNPESITVSLEWAKKIKEAGWPQGDCIWRWVEFHGGVAEGHRDYERLARWELRRVGDDYNFNPRFAAPTAEEILRRLPAKFVHGEAHALYAAVTYRGHPDGIGWIVGYRSFAEDLRHPEIDGQVADTLANASAAMFCFLAKQKLL